MQPLIYEERGNNEKPVLLRLIEEADGFIELCAVNENGEKIATLISFERSAAYTNSFAFTALDAAGYDTSFANWGEKGEISFLAY
jgi:hypothetical protein